MDATNNILASTAHQTLFLGQKKAGMTSTLPFQPTTESIFRTVLYPRPHLINTCFHSRGSTRAITKKFEKSHRQKSYLFIICTPAEFELHQRPFFLAGKTGLIPTKIGETLFSPLRQAYSFF